MDNHKELEKLVDTLMVSERLETPSVDFTQKVLEKTTASISESLKYKPLLPKWILYLVALLIIGFLVYGVSLYATSETFTNYFEDLNKIGLWSSGFFEQLDFSKSLTYTIIVSGLMTVSYTHLTLPTKA